MSFRIAFIGAGSLGFTRLLVADLLGVPEFDDLEIMLHDINKKNLAMVKQLISRDVKENGLKKVKVLSSVNRRTALDGARYVFNVTRIGGLEAFTSDIEVPLTYGVDQCVGDTLCAGGIMYGQRGIRAILDFCKDIRECAEPGAKLFNYANPMAMLTWAANKYGGVECIGLCHG
ncbi:MAG: alpha-glucosidase/alpha-galactosidase, partial [Planctomycetes bacterium]|nr:alpha-glucosidase/alpha-galactosidase [Planctomycetota bacterium]